MLWEEAKEYVKSRIPCTDYLTKSKGQSMYNCPFCGSGTGKNRTGAIKYYERTNTVCCFGSCGKKAYDVIDIYQQTTGKDFKEALQSLANMLGVTIDRPQRIPKKKPQDNIPLPEKEEETTQHATSEPKEETTETTAAAQADILEEAAAADYTEYYKQCRRNLNDEKALAYLNRRGISYETAYNMAVGYDPGSDPASAPGIIGACELKKHPTPRLIIPSSKAHYVGRRIDGSKDFEKINAKGSTPGIMNITALWREGVTEVFVVEGAFDALSLMEIGRQAVALNSTSNADIFIKELEKKRTTATIIISMDNDQSGEKGKNAIVEGLKRLNIPFTVADIACGFNDPNDALCGNKESFINAVNKAVMKAAKRPDNTTDYLQNLFLTDVEKFKNPVRTGFPELDRYSGGLYAGFYVLAATTSLGKTTLALQIADYIATQGRSVLYFSLEQSRLEMVSKSIARTIAQTDKENTVTSLSIRKGYHSNAVQEAIAEYTAAVKDNMSIIEGNFSCDANYISEYVRNYIKRNNARPIVFVDYLQIIQPADEQQSTGRREAIDATVTSFKRLSREFEIPVITLCSVNRANYASEVTMESLKESGGIEYTADVIWGLQLKCMSTDKLFTEEKKVTEKRKKIREERAKNPRELELVCLKNRYGTTDYHCYYNYFPAKDLFVEDDGFQDVGETETPFDVPDGVKVIKR